MKRFYDCSQAEFTNVIRLFVASGTPVTSRVDKCGILYLVKDDGRYIYQVFHMSHDVSAFVVEYHYNLEQIQVISGEIEWFNKVFGLNCV